MENQTPLQILTDTLRKVKKMKNPADNLDPNIVRKYLNDHLKVPFKVDHTGGRRKGNYVDKDGFGTISSLDEDEDAESSALFRKGFQGLKK